jgi:hypothetical protein
VALVELTPTSLVEQYAELIVGVDNPQLTAEQISNALAMRRSVSNQSS